MESMNEILQIKCPWCSAVLTVRNQADIASKNVTCPICKRQSPFVLFKAVLPQAEAHTCYPQPNEVSRNAQGIASEDLRIGKIIVADKGLSFQLKCGKNIVGRLASGTKADIKIDEEGTKKISREHLIIEVTRIPGKGFVHIASLYKERVNPTYINQTPLLYGDHIILQMGDRIILPNVTLRFEIPDEEATEL